MPGIAFCSSDWSTTILADDGRPIPGGAGWYRCHLPAYYLHEHGWDVVHVPHVAYAQLGDGRHRLLPVDFDGSSFATDWVPDIVVLQRWMGDLAAEVIRKCVASGQVIVQDVDDNFDAMTSEHQGWSAVSERGEYGINRETARRTLRHVPDLVNDLRAAAGLDPIVGRNTTTRNNRTHYREALRESSAVVVSTPYLADALQNVNPYVYVVRNAIDLHRWKARTDADDKAGDRPAFGWVGAVPYRQGDLQVLRGTIARFVEASGKRFVHGGHVEGGPLVADALGLDPTVVRTRPIAPIDRYPELFKGIDVGLAPLAANSFSWSKSAVKLTEMCASGIPFVASRMPEYEWFCEGWADDYLCVKPVEWQRALKRIMDPDERARLRSAGLDRVKRDDIEVRGQDWADLYQAFLEA